jgi:hypothetical protein
VSVSSSSSSSSRSVAGNVCDVWQAPALHPQHAACQAVAVVVLGVRMIGGSNSNYSVQVQVLRTPYRKIGADYGDVAPITGTPCPPRSPIRRPAPGSHALVQQAVPLVLFTFAMAAAIREILNRLNSPPLFLDPFLGREGHQDTHPPGYRFPHRACSFKRLGSCGY